MDSSCSCGLELGTFLEFLGYPLSLLIFVDSACSDQPYTTSLLSLWFSYVLLSSFWVGFPSFLKYINH